MGSRTCIGKNSSLIEMNKFIPQLMRDFNLELASPNKEWRLITLGLSSSSVSEQRSCGGNSEVEP